MEKEGLYAYTLQQQQQICYNNRIVNVNQIINRGTSCVYRATVSLDGSFI